MSDESHDTRDQRASVAQAAQMLGISEGAVRKRVERGKMRAERNAAGRLIVYLDHDATATDTTRDRPRPSRDQRSYTRSLEDQVEYLRGQLKEERESRRRADTIIAQLSQANAEQARTIRELEPPQAHFDPEGATEARESPETVEEGQVEAEPRPATGEAQEGARRPWWRRLLGG